MNLWEQLKYRIRYGGPTYKIIAWTAAAFIAVELILVFAGLFEHRPDVQLFLSKYFVAETDFRAMLYKPWSAFTYQFMHSGIPHLFWNMVFFFIAGIRLQNIIPNRSFYFAYFASGVFAFLIQSVATNIFPVYHGENILFVGASGSVTGILIAIVTLNPKASINLFNVVRIPLILIALFHVLSDIFALDSNSGTAHWAHIGGAIFGFLYARLYTKGTDLTKWFSFLNFRRYFKKRSRIRVVKSSKAKVRPGSKKSDENFNASKRERQVKVDQILDKIKDSGYDSLSKAEKDFLFQESKNM